MPTLLSPHWVLWQPVAAGRALREPPIAALFAVPTTLEAFAEGRHGRVLAKVQRVAWGHADERAWVTDRLEEDGASLALLEDRFPWGGAMSAAETRLEAMGFAWPFTAGARAGKARSAPRRRSARTSPKRIA